MGCVTRTWLRFHSLGVGRGLVLGVVAGYRNAYRSAQRWPKTLRRSIGQSTKSIMEESPLHPFEFIT